MGGCAGGRSGGSDGRGGPSSALRVPPTLLSGGNRGAGPNPSTSAPGDAPPMGERAGLSSSGADVGIGGRFGAPGGGGPCGMGTAGRPIGGAHGGMSCAFGGDCGGIGGGLDGGKLDGICWREYGDASGGGESKISASFTPPLPRPGGKPKSSSSFCRASLPTSSTDTPLLPSKPFGLVGVCTFSSETAEGDAPNGFFCSIVFSTCLGDSGKGGTESSPNNFEPSSFCPSLSTEALLGELFLPSPRFPASGFEFLLGEAKLQLRAPLPSLPSLPPLPSPFDFRPFLPSLPSWPANRSSSTYLCKKMQSFRSHFSPSSHFLQYLVVPQWALKTCPSRL
mmetsp:Transcript_15783/g.36294  ORF Transcript_15783/g.36294 Transcript_15783/m.36294 type:complete len:337 (+) Transcript_15783:1189-2199(+)